MMADRIFLCVFLFLLGVFFALTLVAVWAHHVPAIVGSTLLCILFALLAAAAAEDAF